MKNSAVFVSLLDLMFGFLGALTLLTIAYSVVATEPNQLSGDFIILEIAWNTDEIGKAGQSPAQLVRQVRLNDGLANAEWLYEPTGRALSEIGGTQQSHSAFYAGPLSVGVWYIDYPHRFVRSAKITTRDGSWTVGATQAIPIPVRTSGKTVE